MKQRGVRSVSQTNLFNEQFADEYDNILMLMNGSGIIGKLENLPDFFRKMKLLLLSLIHIYVTPNMQVGAEYLRGWRTNLDNSTNHANRLKLLVQYSF